MLHLPAAACDPEEALRRLRGAGVGAGGESGGLGMWVSDPVELGRWEEVLSPWAGTAEAGLVSSRGTDR